MLVSQSIIFLGGLGYPPNKRIWLFKFSAGEYAIGICFLCLFDSDRVELHIGSIDSHFKFITYRNKEAEGFSVNEISRLCKMILNSNYVLCNALYILFQDELVYLQFSHQFPFPYSECFRFFHLQILRQ